MTDINTNKLWDDWLNAYKIKMRKMDGAKGFIKDNTIRQEKTLESHIMYRVNLGTESEPAYLLEVEGEEKKYKYEFLIEFDTDTPEYGIYYGCRAVIDNPELEGKALNGLIDLIKEDWEDVKDEVKKVLNNVFVNKRFDDRTFRMTNNINDNIYWPFWIVLGDEEDVMEVAARATLQIAHIYEKRYASHSYNIDKQILEDSGLPFTKKLPKGELRTFIGHAEEKGYFIKDDLYVGDVYRLNENTPEELSKITAGGKKRGPDNGINLLARIMKYLLKVKVKDYTHYVLGKDGDKLNETTLNTVKEDTYGYGKEEYEKLFETFFGMKFEEKPPIR